MDCQLLYEIAKYIDTQTPNKKLNSAVSSIENRKRKMNYTKKTLEKKITSRESMAMLVNKNIYRQTQVVVDFQYIHRKLRDVVLHRNTYFSEKIGSKISPSLFEAAKNLDFGLRRKILKHYLGRIN